MNKRILRGLVACTAGLWMLFESPTASAKGLAGTEQQVVSILRLANSRFARNPMFRCYHLGRLQGVADRLAVDIVRVSSQQTKNPSQQAQLIYSAQVLHAKLEKKMSNWGVDCDPNLSTRVASNSVPELVHLTKKRLRGTGAQDPVIGCFYAGRLQVLTDRLEKDLRKSSSRGLVELLRQSRETLRAQKSGNCEATYN